MTTTVQQIHNDFYGAEERLFMEAVMLTQGPPRKSSTISQRLQKLGFTSAKPVREEALVSMRALKAEETIRSIEYYRQYYPGYKFINESEVMQLCNKYGLVLGESSSYIGDIPEKNLQDIERFKLREADKVFVQTTWGLEEAMFSSLWTESFNRRRNMPRYSSKVKPFMICAPKQDFNTMGATLADGYKLVNDPIVLQPVKDGYLIVTAWGDEASDEMVVNEQMN